MTMVLAPDKRAQAKRSTSHATLRRRQDRHDSTEPTATAPHRRRRARHRRRQRPQRHRSRRSSRARSAAESGAAPTA